jgi:hypothetical protein
MSGRHSVRTQSADASDGTATTFAADFPGGPERNRIFPFVSALVIFFCTGVLAPLLVGSLHISHSPQFSPIDEINHYDYVTRLAAGGFPRLGQDIQPSSIRELQCHGLHLLGVSLPACGSPFTTADRAGYRATITQYEAQQPPTYYALTVPLRWVAIHVFGFEDLTATRVAGLLWLVAGLFTLWVACRVLGLSPAWIGAGLLLISTSPVVMDSASIVSNDAGGIMAGSLVLLAGALAWRQPWKMMPLTLFAVALVVTSFKTVDVIVVMAVAALFAVLEITRTRQGAPGGARAAIRRFGATGGALAAGGVLSALGWLVASHQLAIVDPQSIPTWQVLRGRPNGFTDVLREAVTLLAPMSDSFGAIYPAGTATVTSSARWLNVATVLAELVTVMILAAALSGLFATPRRWFHWAGLVAVPALYAGGVALGYSVHYAYKIDTSLTGRYGLAMVPLLVLVLVAAGRGRWVLGGVWAFGVFSLVTTIVVIA